MTERAAKRQRTEEASPQEAAAAHSGSIDATTSAASVSATRSSGPHLHQHALLSIFKFLPLRQQCLLSGVSRDWQKAVRNSPSGSAWRRFAGLPAVAMEDFARNAFSHGLIQQANDPARKQFLLRKWQRRLREQKCMAVAKPLLSLLHSASVTRKRFDEADVGDVWLSLQLPAPDSAAAAASVSAQTAIVRVQWSQGEAIHGDARDERWKLSLYPSGSDRSIDHAPQQHQQLQASRVLLDYVRWRRDRYDLFEQQYTVGELAVWLRAQGIFAGSQRQQCALLTCCAQALLQMASDRCALPVLNDAEDESTYQLLEQECWAVSGGEEDESMEAEEPPLSAQEQKQEQTEDEAAAPAAAAEIAAAAIL